MKKLISLCMIICLSALLLMGCGEGVKSGDTKIFYLSTDKLSIVPVKYKFENSDTEKLIDEVLVELSKETGEIDYMMSIPSGVTVQEWKLEKGNLSLYLTGEYNSLEVYTEILVRAAIVKTLVQIDGVDSVSFYIDNSPYIDATGVAVGAMTADTFIDDFGEETDSLLSTTLTLYFASADGMSVVAEAREVYYSRNVAIEKLIVEQLLKGPDTEGLISPIPADTKINSVSVTNGVCYVNFDAAFETAISGVTENTTVYSIVNSLTELDSIKQVQLLVNGETPHLSNLDVDLNAPINRNSDIINENFDADYMEPDLDENGDVIEVEDVVVGDDTNETNEEQVEENAWEESE